MASTVTCPACGTDRRPGSGRCGTCGDALYAEWDGAQPLRDYLVERGEHRAISIG